MSTAPNSSLSETAKHLPALLEALRSALEHGADNQLQRKAFGLGCSLLGKLVDSIAQDLSRIDDVRKQTTGVNISIPNDQFQQFIDDEIELLKKFGFSGQDLDGFKRNLSAVKGDLDNLRFDSSDAVAALQEFRDLLCRLETLAATELLPNSKNLIKTCISGVIDVGTVSADVAVGGGAIVTGVGWLALPVVLLSIGSLKAGYLSLRRIIPKLRELTQSEEARRESVRRQIKLKQGGAKHNLRLKDDDKK